MLKLVNTSNKILTPEDQVKIGDRFQIHGVVLLVNESYISCVGQNNSTIWEVLGIEHDGFGFTDKTSPLYHLLTELWGYPPRTDDGAPEWNYDDMEAATKTIRFIQSKTPVLTLPPQYRHYMGELNGHELELREGALFVGCNKVEVEWIETLLPLVKKYKEEYDAIPPEVKENLENY